MAEKITSELGFDASEALRAIAQLGKGFLEYSKSLNATADASSRTAKQQAEIDKALTSNAKSIKSQVSALSALAKAYGTLNRATPKVDLQAQSKVAASARASVEQSLFTGLRGKASLGEVVNFDKSLDAFEKLVAKTDVSEAQITKVLSNLRGQYTGTERTIRDAIAKIVASTGKLGAANVKAQAGLLKKIGDPAGVARAAQVSFERGLLKDVRGEAPPTGSQTKAAQANARTITQSIQEITISWSALGRIAISQALLGQIRSLVGAFAEGAKAAIDFELSLARIQTLDQTFRSGGLSTVGEAVTDLAAEFGRPIDDVAAGLYDTLSNQIGNAAESTRFLRDALTLSVATVSTTTQSVDVLTGVINSYGLSAASAGSISDKLFKTVDLGNVKLQDMANSLGRITPLAATLGISLDEVLASVAELTIQGVDFADASTQITNVMLKLIRPTENLQNRFQQMGVASAEAGIAAFGFQGFLQEITKEAGPAASEIGELFNQIRGTRGVIGLVAVNAERYQKTLKQIREDSAGAAQEAANVILQTPAAQIQKQLSELEGFLVNDFGRSFNQVFLGVANSVGGIVPAFKVAATAVGVLATAFAGLIVINQIGSFLSFFNAQLAATVPLAKALAVLRFGTLFAVPAAAGAGLALLIANMAQGGQSATEFRSRVQELGDAFDSELKQKIQDLEPVIKNNIKDVGAVVAAAEQSLQARTRLAEQDRQVAITTQEQITQSFQDQLSRRESLVQQFVGRLVSVQTDAVDKIKNLQNETTGLRNQSGQRQFERSIRGLSEQEQGVALISRSQQLLQAAQTAAGKGNIDISKDLFASADDLANRAADLGQGEQQVNAVLQARIGLNDRLVQQQNQQAQEAKRLEAQQRSVANAVASEVQRIGSLQDQLQQGLRDGSLNKDTEKQLRADLTASAGKLQGLFGQVSIGNLGNVSEFAKLLQQVRAPFQSALSNQPVSLTFGIEEGVNQVFATLQQQARATPIQIRVALEDLSGKPFDFNNGLQEGQKQLAATNKEYQRLEENQKNVVSLQSDANKNINVASEASRGAAKNFEALGQTIFSRKIIGESGFFEADPGLISQGQQLGQIVGDNFNTGIKAAIEGDAGALKASLDSLRANLGAVRDARAQQGTVDKTAGLLGVGPDPILGALEDQLTTGIAALQAAAEGQLQVLANQGLEPVRQKVIEVSDAIISIPTSVQTSTSAVESGANAQAASWARAEQAVDNYSRKVQAAGAGGVAGGAQSFARGGKVLHFANGGFVPRSDTQPAMLTPGEIVLNPAASRRFALDASAMNLGLSPRSGGSAGAMTQNVSINVSGSGDPNAVADAVIRRLERGRRARIYR